MFICPVGLLDSTSCAWTIRVKGLHRLEELIRFSPKLLTTRKEWQTELNDIVVSRNLWCCSTQIFLEIILFEGVVL